MIKNILAFLIAPFDERKQEQKYLNEAKDLYDLEYRFKQIDKGLAPFQKIYRSF
jgi:hypothetical protein